MPSVFGSISLPWKDGAALMGTAAVLPWKDGTSVLCAGGPYTPAAPPVGGTPVDPAPLDPRYRIAPASVYAAQHTASVKDLRDDTVLQFDSFTLSADEASVFWSFSGDGGAGLYAQLTGGEQPAQIEAAINGVVWRFVVTDVARSRGVGQTSVTVSGQSLAAAAGAPYSPEQNWVIDGATTAAQIAATANVLTGLGVQWNVEDWLIPDRVFTHAGSPLSVVRRVAETIAAVVQSDRSEFSVKVMPRYATMPNEWPNTAPDVEIALDAVGSDSIQRTDAPEYNGVYLSGQQSGAVGYVSLEGTNGAQLHPLVTDLLLTDEPALRQRGMAILGGSGEQTRETLADLPVLNGTDQPGVFDVGWLARVVDPAETWYGVVRSVSVTVALPSIDQTVVLERHTKPLPGTVVDDSAAPSPLVFAGTIPTLTAVVGTAFSLSLSSYFSGGTSPYVYSMRYGTLPAALALNPSTGAVTGTFGASQALTTLAFRATDAEYGQDDTNFFNLQAVVALTYTGTIPGQSLTVGTPFSLATASYWSNGLAPYVWSLASGTLPAGVTLNTSTGVVSGTPTTAGTLTGVSFTVTDALGTARTSNTLTFTTAAGGPDAFTMLQLNFNGTNGSQSIDDESANNLDVTTGDSTRTIYTGDSKFGSGCLRTTTVDGGPGLAWFGSSGLAFSRPASTAITIEGWFKRPSQATVVSGNPYRPILFTWGYGTGATGAYAFDNGDGDIYCVTSGGSWAPVSVADDTWHFLQMISDSSGNTTFRINGTSVGTAKFIDPNDDDSSAAFFAITQMLSPDATALDYRLDGWRFSRTARSTTVPTAAF